MTIVPERLRAVHLAGFYRYVQTREPRLIGRPVRVPALAADGSEVEVELRLSAFRTRMGQDVFVASLRDLSERVELERQLALARYLQATSEVAVRLGLSGEVANIEEAAPLVLEALGTSLGWDLGAMWMVGREGRELVCIEVWRAPHVQDAGFEEVTRKTRMAPEVGLPGRVWASGQPAWVTDVVEETGFPRATLAARQGLHGAFAFPIRSGTKVLGVVEFFSREAQEPDNDLLGVISTVGQQLGQFMERQRAERSARFRAAVLASEAEASIDGVLVVDPDGEVLFWNQQLQDMAGSHVDFSSAVPGRQLLGAAAALLADADAFVGLVDRLCDDPEQRTRTELGLVDGRTLDCYSSPLRGEDGVLYGRGWYFRDITEQKRAEQRFASLASTLQSSLLPPQAPDVPGLDVAFRYRPAGYGIEVGGDFYDLFPVKGNAWGLAIGDVCGKGPEAARLTALARYTIRAAAMRVRSPRQALGILNDAVLREDPDGRFLTVVAGRLRPGTSRSELVLSCGGHPLPLVIRADGSVEPVGRPGTLIGLFERLDVSDARVYLGPGDAVVLYTDGVTEARGERGMLGQVGLATILGAAAGGSADDLADGVIEGVLAHSGGEPRDDVALVVVRMP